MIDMYEWIKGYYLKDLYNIGNLSTFVSVRWITEAQKEEMTLYKENLKKEGEM